MAQVSSQPKTGKSSGDSSSDDSSTDQNGKGKSLTQEASDAPFHTRKTDGVTTEALKKLLGAAYGSNVELLEEKEDGDNPEPYVAKVRSVSYGTGTFVIDGRGDSAEAARTDLWNRVPRYKGAQDPDVLSYPHDYSQDKGAVA